MTEENNPNFNDKVKLVVTQVLKDQLQGPLFTARKLTDIPTDSLSVVNRRFVTLNGTTAGRPVSSILGQFYFDTSLGYPVWWDGSTWVDASGSPT